MSNQKNYDEVVVKHAYAVWEVMHSEAKKRGLARERNKLYGDGRIMVNTVGSFIGALGSERNWNLTNNQKDLIRRYLKASGNVVVLEKIEQYRFRIFVREEWTNKALIQPITPTSAGPHQAIAKGEHKLTPEEAGETREPAPVVHKCAYCDYTTTDEGGIPPGHMQKHPDKTKAHARRQQLKERLLHTPQERLAPLSEYQATFLATLGRIGGVVSHKNNATGEMARLSELPSRRVTQATAGLRDRGLITKEGKGKRTYKYTMTDEGWEVFNHLNEYRHGYYVVREFIEKVGHVQTKAGRLSPVIAESLNIATHRVSSALRTLSDEGLITYHVKEGKTLPHAVTWNGQRPSNVTQPEPALLTQTTDIAEQTKKIEETVEGWTQALASIDNANLLGELRRRLMNAPDLTEENEDLRQKLSLIASLVQDVMDGKIAPLKALGEIEEAVKL